MFYQMNHTGSSYRRGRGRKMTKAERKRDLKLALLFAFVGIPLLGFLLSLLTLVK